ncbi:transcriptional regulatory protein AfsQ1 [Maritalea myrionectae]|uniref:Transcriptional regulatory protein AfsQ1 n=1 Tax=Maritalea myrionectae TaxID=454601 RepID=A0A2R4MIF7_9HYPH|nr:response regulator [Maritalea myrionectae]AVX05723.1 transcriptional regulatory protein AfsQ1 [Maritalea myrionectae]
METVLLIDDDDQIIDFLTPLLQEEGFRVLSCADGEAGLNLLKTTTPDLIVVDAMMPRIDGYQFLWHLNASPQTADIPTMMLTSRANASDVSYGKSLGADVYLTKPFQGKEVIACLNYLRVVSQEARKTV